MGCSENRVEKGNQALRIGDYQRAVENFSQVLDKSPMNRDARYGLALSYYAMAEEKEPVHVPTMSLWEKTAREFKILSKVDSSGSINGAYSTCLFYLAKATAAESPGANILPTLDKSIRLDSLNYFSYNLKALVLKASGKLQEAKDIYIYVVTKEPRFISAYINLGNIYWDEGDVESAWDIWSLGLEQAPENTTLQYWTKVAEESLKQQVLEGRL